MSYVKKKCLATVTFLEPEEPSLLDFNIFEFPLGTLPERLGPIILFSCRVFVEHSI